MSCCKKLTVKNLFTVIVIITSAMKVMFLSAFGLFVSKVTQNLLSRFSQNSVKTWHMDYGRNGQILVVNLDHVTLGVVLGYRFVVTFRWIDNS